MLALATAALSGRVKRLSKMTFGFGGKTLYSGLALIISIIGLVVAVDLVNRGIDIVNYARTQTSLTIDIRSTESPSSPAKKIVTFRALPFVDTTLWGEADYDIKWYISGTEYFTYEEFSRNFENPSFFSRELSPGQYKVVAVVESEHFYEISESSFEITEE